jgi:flagellar biosynthetic protein FliR
VTEAELLAMLPALAFQAALVFCRVGACAMVLPGLGEQDVPPQLRLGLGLSLVPVLLPVLAPSLPAPPDAAAEALRLVALEVAVGLWLGWLARLVVLALGIAGQMLAFLLGLSSVLFQDPTMGGQTAITSRFFALAAVALVLSTGLYALPLRALAESYALLPAGAPLAAGPAAEAVVAMTSESFALALRLAAPFVLLSLVLQAATGLLSRIVPQVQAFVIIAPAQVLGGLLLLALVLPALLMRWGEAASAIFPSLPGLR